MVTMKSLISLVNNIQWACTMLGDYGGVDGTGDALPTLWETLPFVVVIGVPGSSDDEKSMTSVYEMRDHLLVESSRKRNDKEVSLSSLGHIVKKQRSSSSSSRPKTTEVFASGIGKQEKPYFLADVSHKCSSIVSTKDLGDDLKEHHENPNILGNNVVIPKRPQGTSRQTKTESPTSLNTSTSDSTCTGKNGDKAQINQPFFREPNDRPKRKFDDLKENAFDRNTSVFHIKGKSECRRVRSRKKNGSKAEEQTYLEKQAPLVGEGGKLNGDFQEDDEDNLEENAAWMLSSRFNPTCMGSSGNRIESSQNSANGSLIHLVTGYFKKSLTESSRIDSASRVLRPKKHDSKGFARKRRHFYEVCSADVDPYYILKQRIKIFWPLDKSWYFGRVRGYDPKTKLHHVKYNDLDEEWINLKHARFKLLLFPSEVTCKCSSGRSRLEFNQIRKEDNRKAIDGNSICSSMQLKPIISWSAQSTKPVESSPDTIIKKHSSAHLLKDLKPSISLEPKGQMDVSPSIISNTLFHKSAVLNWSVGEAITKLPVLRSRTDLGNRRLSFVYFRKRFHKRRVESEHGQEQASASGSSASCISILAPTDRLTALDGLNIISTSMNLKQVTLKLRLPTQFIYGVAYGAESIWLSRAFFILQFGKLMPVWPLVHMEIVFVDNTRGLRILSFAGCLRWVVSLACFIIRSFFQDNEQSKVAEWQMPSTSIGFKLSGLHDQGHQLRFVLCSFMELESSKWKFLEESFKQKCVTIRELPRTECTYSNIRALPSRIIEIFYTSDFLDPVSFGSFPERSCSDIINRRISMNPALVYFDEKYEKDPPCSLSFATAPSLLSLHLKLLIENTASVNLQKPNLISSQECSDYHGKLNTYGLSPVEDNSDQVSQITLENLGSSLDQGAIISRTLPFGHLKVETDALSLSEDGMRCFKNIQNSEVSHGGVAKNKSNVAVVQFRRFPCCARSWEGAEKSCSSSEDYCSPDKSNGGCNSCSHSTIVHAKPFAGVVEESFDKGSIVAKSSSGLILDARKHSINSSNPTAPPSIWHQNSHRSASLTSGPLPKLWQEDFMQNGVFSGLKKPGNQILTFLPAGGFGISSKPQSNRQKAQNCRRTKASDAKRISVPQSFAESLPCDANVLITAEDRGWRECGAQVVLDSDDQKDWMICVKFSGATKYVHKAQQFLQPGITNQYSHAIIWKGGKNWALEFTDRGAWLHFKEMHEECCNRNIRASSVRNIPIPGVRLIANGDDNIVEVPFIRNSSNYIRLVGTEVDMALDPSHVLYDMDSSDEEWILKMRNSSHSHWSKMSKVTYDIFERVMDMFEKLSYIQQCDEFTNNEIERFIANVGPLDVIKAIHEHWQQKRQKKGLPLIRQFQPALWEYYQQQLKKWESFVSQMHSSSSGCQDRECSVKKPPMFAFCLKPRGLEVPNKWLTQRSQKRFMFTGHRRTFAREKDGFRSLGRKWNRVSVGAKKAFVANLCHESADSFDCLKFPSRSSQRDTVRKRILTMDIDGSQKYQYVKHYRNNQRKTQMFPFPNYPEMLPSSYDGKSEGNAVQWSSGIYKRLSMKQSPSDRYRRHRADTDEFQLHDVRAVAQHASNMVKLKREKAQWLVHKADLAIHKAMVALIIVEAMKASEK